MSKDWKMKLVVENETKITIIPAETSQECLKKCLGFAINRKGSLQVCAINWTRFLHVRC